MTILKIPGKRGGGSQKYILNPPVWIFIFDNWWHARWCIRYSTVSFEVLRNGKNWNKKRIFWLIFWVFLFTPSHPVNYTPRFCQMKELMKIYIYGKYHQYSICGFEIKNFQSFLCWFSIHKMALFGGFFGFYIPKYCSILLKFWPEVIQ